MEKKICVVLVTFNRKEYLIRLLDSLKLQTKKIDSIIIVDNHSSDSTFEYLKEQNYLNIQFLEEDKLYKNNNNEFNIYYYYSSINTGGSGGFNKGFEIFKSLEDNFDYLWVMDDDVLPNNNCLELLLSKMDSNTGLCIPNRTDNNYKDYAIVSFNMSNPFLVYMQKKKKIYDLLNSEYFIEDMPFEGPLIKSEIVDIVGLPDKEYFIFYDDSDYCRRILQHTKGKFVTDAILHKQIIPKIDKNKKMNWRHYYSYRNAIYFEKKYGNNFLVRNFSPLLFVFELCVKNILLFRFYNLKIILKAFNDANKGIRGKSVEPGSF